MPDNSVQTPILPLYSSNIPFLRDFSRDPSRVLLASGTTDRGSNLMRNLSKKALAINAVLLLGVALWTSRLEARAGYVKSVTCPRSSLIPVQPAPIADCEPGTSPLDFQGSVTQRSPIWVWTLRTTPMPTSR
jgi:hypothetical protein